MYKLFAWEGIVMRQDEKSKRGGKPAAAILTGVVIGYAVIFALFAVASLLVAKGLIPESAMGHAALFCSFTGGAVGAVTAIRAIRRRPLVFALADGAAMFAVAFLTRAFSDSDKLFSGLTMYLFLAIIAGSCVGGLFCARKPGRKRA
jgi:putative membrane protein (TIGR04086 family)